MYQSEITTLKATIEQQTKQMDAQATAAAAAAVVTAAAASASSAAPLASTVVSSPAPSAIKHVPEGSQRQATGALFLAVTAMAFRGENRVDLGIEIHLRRQQNRSCKEERQHTHSG